MDIKLIPDKYKKGDRVGIKKEASVLGRLAKKATPKGNLLLILTIGFLIVVVLASLGLLGYQNSLAKQKASLVESIEKLQDQRNADLESNFTELGRRIKGFEKSLKRRVYFSKIFEMIEELTLSQIKFVDMNIDLSQNNFKLKAEADSYSALAKQIIAFEEDARIKSIELSKVGLSIYGRVASELSIELNNDFLFSE